jgi:hypothetical protein
MTLIPDLIALISERREQLIKAHVYDADILKWQSQLRAALRAKKTKNATV